MYFSLEDNCFTTLSWFLPYISMNQPYWTSPPPWTSFSSSTPHSIPPLKLVGCTNLSTRVLRAPGWAPASLSAKLLQSCLTLWPYRLQPPRLLCPWDSPGKNTGVGCMSSSRGSFQPRDQTWISYVSCIEAVSLPLVPPGKSWASWVKQQIPSGYLFYIW